MIQKKEFNNFSLSKLDEEPMVKRVGCIECGYKGFVLIEQERGQPIAKKCKCYEEFLRERNNE